MRSRLSVLMVTVMLIVAGAVTLGFSGVFDRGFTYDFGLRHTDQFDAVGGNRYMNLNPGRILRYEGVEDGDLLEVLITITPATRSISFEIDGVEAVAEARVIEEREWINGELSEVSRNFFARHVATNNIYYFGEEVDIYHKGEIIGHDGSWLAGVDNARPGLFMPAQFLIGARYYHEIAPGIAIDRAEHLAMNARVETPFGVFDDCIVIEETSEIEPDEETLAVYASGVGLIVDGPIRLVEMR
ncbi:MAG: hypothetical protein ACF8PN_02255 [Phycisphaerales bacterium]